MRQDMTVKYQPKVAIVVVQALLARPSSWSPRPNVALADTIMSNGSLLTI